MIYKHHLPQDRLCCSLTEVNRCFVYTQTGLTPNEQSWWESSFPRMTSAESSRSFIIFIWEGRSFICSLTSNRYTIKGGIIPPSGNHFIYKEHVEPSLLSLPDGVCAQATEGRLHEYLTFLLKTAGSITPLLAKSERKSYLWFSTALCIFSGNSESIKTPF